MAGVTVTGRANARIGLLGNPSDGYRGRVIAATIADFAAAITAGPASRWEIEAGDGFAAGSIAGVRARVGDDAGAATLIAAALAVAESDEPALVAGPPLALSFETSVPREVGLAGSSAIVTAALRALAEARKVAVPSPTLARLTLDAEVRILGWAAGPQDRIIQAHGGVLDMDFAAGWKPAAWRPVDPGGLPPLVLAWDERTAAPSGIVHRDVRSRWEASDPEVIATMQRFAAIAAEGSDALAAGAAASRWPDLLDESWQLRCRFWHLTDRDRALVAAARRYGVGASLAGSGGAIVGVARDPNRIDEFVAAVRATGAEAIVPTIAPALDRS